MTTHAMTLPGIGSIDLPHTAGCRGVDCHLVVGPAHPEDTTAAWHAALKGGAKAIDLYLARYNAEFEARHAGGCAFRYLPPSVHVACKEHYEALEAECELANKARFDFNQ